ncbi:MULTISPECIES: PQQ-binding-like beta-propeller repeat protein [unclassified Mycolicibacterium]|uniref:outer membrane protein assembly factor BamB family protein n=1 Tax=unclassified Mycolicibacterium TaxID=2636767 RepID=UPI001390E1A5|nr:MULTISPECIES: PQQ-binding-like beta-propeller repeat protein [unclassified Mycolicibacterium]
MTYPNDPFSSAGGAPNPYPNPFGNQPPPTSPFPGGGHPFPPADPSFGQFPPVYQAGYQPAGPPPEPPREKRKVWLVLTVVAAVVFASAGLGAVLWWLNRGGGAGEVTAAGGGPLPTSVPPLGDLRPPADVVLPSLEQPIGTPRWTYETGIDAYVLGGDAYTVVVGSDQGVMALDKETGEPRWSQAVKPPKVNINRFGSAKCVITRSAKTMGCGLNLNLCCGDPEVLVFLDVATGRILSQPSLPSDRITNLQGSGDGIAVVFRNELVSYGADGNEAWRVRHDGVSVFGDQGVVITEHEVIDANTGKPIVSEPNTSNTAFASGFAVSFANSFKFFDFSGRNTATVPSEGYTLMGNVGSGLYQFPLGHPENTRYGSSGFYYPLAYNRSTGDFRAFDGKSGRILWTFPTGSDMTLTDMIGGFGSGELCMIGVTERADAKMRAGTCQDVNTAPSANVPMTFFLGSDGTRFLHQDQHNLICVDGVSGKELWRKEIGSVTGEVWVSGGAYVTKDKTVTRLI